MPLTTARHVPRNSKPAWQRSRSGRTSRGSRLQRMTGPCPLVQLYITSPHVSHALKRHARGSRESDQAVSATSSRDPLAQASDPTSGRCLPDRRARVAAFLCTCKKREREMRGRESGVAHVCARICLCLCFVFVDVSYLHVLHHVTHAQRHTRSAGLAELSRPSSGFRRHASMEAPKQVLPYLALLFPLFPLPLTFALCLYMPTSPHSLHPTHPHAGYQLDEAALAASVAIERDRLKELTVVLRNEMAAQQEQYTHMQAQLNTFKRRASPHTTHDDHEVRPHATHTFIVLQFRSHARAEPAASAGRHTGTGAPPPQRG